MKPNLIKAARKIRGMTQAQVATQLGIARSTVAKWETGANYPRANILPALADLLQCSIDDLLDDDLKK